MSLKPPVSGSWYGQSFRGPRSPSPETIAAHVSALDIGAGHVEQPSSTSRWLRTGWWSGIKTRRFLFERDLTRSAGAMVHHNGRQIRAAPTSAVERVAALRVTSMMRFRRTVRCRWCRYTSVWSVYPTRCF